MMRVDWLQVGLVVVVGGLAGFGASVASADVRPIDHEALWAMPRVAAPVLSPDGRRVVVPVLEPAYEAEQQRGDLWLLDATGKTPPQRLTGHAGMEASPAFSADGRMLAFVVRRAGDAAPQAYAMALDGGEAQRVTAMPGGARAPRWSPDGRSLLFVADAGVGVEDAAAQQALVDEREARDHRVRVYTGFPIRNWDRWLGEDRPQLFVTALDGQHAVNLLAGSELVRQPGYGGRGLLGTESLDAEWAPDGQSVVFVASANRDRSAYAFIQFDIWQVPAGGGEPRRLTGSPDGAPGDSHSRLVFSADGKYLFALLAPRTDSVYNASRLVRFDWPSMRHRRVLEAPGGLSIGSFALANRSGSEVWFSAESEGQEVVYRGGFDGRAPRLVARPGAGVYTGLVAAGSGRDAVLVARHETATQPPEVVRIDPAKGSHTYLSSFTTERAQALDLAPLEHFWFERAGRRIHSMLVRPPEFDPARKYPLLVLMHGGPHTMWRDQWVLRWNYHLLAAPGYVVLLTNYTGSTGFGEDFARGILGDPLRGPALDINQAADEAIARFPFIDGSRQCAGGASYGGHLANWMQGTTDRYRCLVSHAGLVNLESQWGTSDIVWTREAANGGPVWEQGEVWRTQNPIRLAANFRTPTLLTVGEKDYRVPLNNALEYWTALQRQRVESRFLVFPEENHWILKAGNSRYFYQEVHDWLARWLGED